MSENTSDLLDSWSLLSFLCHFLIDVALALPSLFLLTFLLPNVPISPHIQYRSGHQVLKKNLSKEISKHLIQCLARSTSMTFNVYHTIHLKLRIFHTSPKLTTEFKRSSLKQRPSSKLTFTKHIRTMARRMVRLMDSLFATYVCDSKVTLVASYF